MPSSSSSSPTAAKKRFLSSLIPLLERNGCVGDLLYLREETLAVNKDKTTTDISRESEEGVKLRVFDGRRYHELGLSSYDESALKRAAKELGSVPMEQPTMALTIPVEPLNATYSALGRIDPATVPLKEKIAAVKRIHAMLLCSSKKLVNGRIYYDEMRETKIYVCKGRELSQEIGGCLFVIVAFVKSEEGDIRYHYDSLFGHGWERAEIPTKEVVKVARFAERIAAAKRLTPGKYLCLLTPQLSGLLAHESFGHGMEADTLYKGRALAAEWLGKRIAAPSISIADGPAVLGSHGFFFFDDEGQLATKTLMVEKGVVKLPLTDAYHAAKLKLPRTSNGRAESFDHKVYCRMTNTYFEPGNVPKAALLTQMKDGLLLHTASGGMEDPKGWGIQIHGVVAEHVKDGKPTGELYYEVGMTGYLPDLLKNIIGVSKEFAMPGNGRCGKGHHDWVRVSEGGPYLLIKDVVLS